MAIDNKTLLQKADTALSDLTTGGGILKPAQADTFIRLAIKGSVLMKMATVTPMKAPKQEFPKARFGSRVLVAGTESTPVSAGSRVRPDLSYVGLDAKLFRAEVDISDEALEDSVERGNFKETIIELLAAAIGRDLEEIAINADTASSDTTLAQFDGLLKQATSHVIDGAAADISYAIFKNAMKTIPSQYLVDKTQIKFLSSVNAEIGYRNLLGNRNTPGGDRWISDDTPVGYGGIGIVPVPLFPETQGTSPNNDRTSILLTNPKNIMFGIWRQIRIEQWRDPTQGVFKLAASVRFDAKFQNEDAVAKVWNIKLT